MGTCPFCDHKMKTADSCTKNMILYPIPGVDGGNWANAIPYGKEQHIQQSVDLNPRDRCPDCSVAEGGYHHPGCKTEESPITGAELLGDVRGRPRTLQPIHARGQRDPHAENTIGSPHES